jgi:hypothetical protein
MSDFKAGFLGSLSPPDFSGAAKTGWFVYVYLRRRHGFARQGTPYYVGIASRANRPCERHSCPVPADKSLIRIMRSGLSRAEANKWERFYIAKFGRKNLGAGILLNLTDGGDGSPGHTMSPEAIKRIIAGNKGKIVSPETRARISAANKGRQLSQTQKEFLRQFNLGKKQSPEHVEARAAACRGVALTQEHRARIAEGLRGYVKSDAAKKKQSETRIRNAAAKKGMSYEEYIQTPKFLTVQRNNARQRQLTFAN